MGKTVFLFKQLEFFLSDIHDPSFSTIYKLNRGGYYQDKLIRLSYPVISKMLPFLFSNWKEEMNQIDTFVFFDSHYSSQTATFIKEKNKDAKIIFYFWNTISRESQIERFKDPRIDEFWTYDPNDAKKYGLYYNPQFYTKNKTLEKENPKTDIFFLGREKDRKETLLQLQDAFLDQNLTAEILISSNKHMLLSYEKYLKKLAQTNAILDVVAYHQGGLSLRCMESLFFDKKLITNNQMIEECPFYHPENIFVLEKHNVADIKDFLQIPYRPVEEKIKEEYDASTWVKRFSYHQK